MLTAMDDYQCHQTPDTVDHAATDHPSFYERYWFVFGDVEGKQLFGVGLAGYPNRQIVDGFVVATLGGETQRNMRFSRDSNRDRQRNWVGPLRVEVLEGLKRLRVTLQPNRGLAFDIVFEARQGPWERAPDFSRYRGRVLNQTNHLNQMGHPTGWVEVDGVRTEVTPRTWYALRDRSWGIRPIDPSLDPPPKLDRSDKTDPTGLLWQFICIQWPDEYSHWQRRNVATRVPRRLSGAFIPSDGGRPTQVTAVDIVHIEYQSLYGDLRRFRSGVWRVTDETGRVREVSARAVSMFSHKAAGYHPSGYKGFTHGAWMGEAYEDGETWDLKTEEGQRALEYENSYDHWSEFECEGVKGFGMVEITGTAGCRWFEHYQPDSLKIVE